MCLHVQVCTYVYLYVRVLHSQLQLEIYDIRLQLSTAFVAVKSRKTTRLHVFKNNGTVFSSAWDKKQGARGAEGEVNGSEKGVHARKAIARVSSASWNMYIYNKKHKHIHILFICTMLSDKCVSYRCFMRRWTKFSFHTFSFSFIPIHSFVKAHRFCASQTTTQSQPETLHRKKF